MKEFLRTNKITYNLMSLTGYKAIYIFSLLLESPKSYDEIKDAISTHEYLHESISTDAIRIYLNSLRKAGCHIEGVYIDKVRKYKISSHPFELKITDSQAKSIIKLYKIISKSIEFSEFLLLQKFFEKFCIYVENEKLKQKLQNLSPFSNIEGGIINDLMKYVKNKKEITILYNSPNSGRKNIDILTDRLLIKNGKLYLSGVSIEHKNYHDFLVSRIIKIVSVNMKSSEISSEILTVRYEYTKNEDFPLEILPEEKVVQETSEKYIIEISSKNKFEIAQRILAHANLCRVISPLEFKDFMLSCLKKMKEGYFE